MLATLLELVSPRPVDPEPDYDAMTPEEIHAYLLTRRQ